MGVPKKAETDTKTKTDKKIDKDRYIYLGPTIAGSINLVKNTVFIGMPEINKLYEVCPEIKKLFATTKDMNKIKEKITQKGTYEHSLNEKIYDFIRNGGI